MPPTAVHLCVAFALGAGAARHALSSPFLRYCGRARPAPQLHLISWTFRLGLSVSLPCVDFVIAGPAFKWSFPC